MTETLVQVRAPRFTAGMVLIDGVVTVTAPILRRWCQGKTADEARRVIKLKGWTAIVVDAIVEPSARSRTPTVSQDG